jgi:tRNA A-37 threonylcarbamoyl transferase component Bud32
MYYGGFGQPARQYTSPQPYAPSYVASPMMAPGFGQPFGQPLYASPQPANLWPSPSPAYAQARPASGYVQNYSAPSPSPLSFQQQAYAPRVTPAPAPAMLGGSAPAMPYAQPQVMGGMGARPSKSLKSLLQDRSVLKKAVVDAFKAASGGRKAIDINGLLRLRMDLAGKLGVPDAVFGSLEEEYMRFDFEGTGYLEANEVYKLVKWHIYEYAKQQDMAMGKNTVPMKNPTQAGFTIMKELGSGNQAALKLAIDQHGNQRCIKCFPKASMMNMFSIQDMMEEFETMQRLACKNIARTFEIFQDQSTVYMVNEVYHGGDFKDVQRRATAKIGALNESWYGNVFRQCLDALNFMHQQAMMHCDIKEPNLMMRTENYSVPQVVLIDFGVSRAMTKRDTGTVSGTPGYMPPETMNAGKWYPGGDVFSLGVVIFQMMSGKIPDDEAAKRGAPMIGLFLEGCNSLDDVRNLVCNKRPPVQMMQASPALQQVTLRMLEKNFRARPKAPTIMKDPWFGSSYGSNTKNPEAMMMAEHPLATMGITEDMLR